MDLFFEVHRDLPREGPGDDASTTRALGLCGELPSHPRVLDIGCGPGMQTLQLARLIPARIFALDNHQPFLDDLTRRAGSATLRGRIQPLRASMFDLPFASERFDLIWSEGAIYIAGFENGLRAGMGLLKPGGYAAVTELTWIKADPPAEIAGFWGEFYPAMNGLEENRRIVRDLGFREVATFVLPESAWMEPYYGPLEQRLAILRQKYAGQPAALAFFNDHQKEVDMYRKYSAWYGYVFYVMQKPQVDV